MRRTPWIALCLLGGVAHAATELRFTGDELAARGAVDLASAIALLPDVTVRDDGRGGQAIELRGARGGAVSLRIDGVLVDDPADGGIDLAAVPVADIAELRVATTPQSPLDGPGGAGGIIEVQTRDALGPQLVIGRVTADSQPSLGAAGVARVPLARRLGLRLIMAGQGGARDLPAAGNAEVDEERRAATGGARLEYRNGDRRFVLDGFLDERHHVAPPSDDPAEAIRVIDRATTARGAIGYDDRFGALQLRATAWSQYLARRSRFYAGAARTSELRAEDQKTLHSGAEALATMPFLDDFRWTGTTRVDFEKVAVANLRGGTANGELTLFNVAGGLAYAHGPLRADLAASIVIPSEVGANPWPEALANVGLRADPRVELTATAAYKGRVPTLRERFDPVIGNRGLAPEDVLHFELRAIGRPADWLRVELAPYYRHIENVIELQGAMQPVYINFGKANQRGFDGQARAAGHGFAGGLAYAYVHIDSAPATDEPLRRLPAHRWDGWLSAQPDPRVGALARLSYFGVAHDEGRHVDRYAIVEAELTGRLAPGYLAVLRADDLLDARPDISDGVPSAGRVISLLVQGTWQ